MNRNRWPDKLSWGFGLVIIAMTMVAVVAVWAINSYQAFGRNS